MIVRFRWRLTFDVRTNNALRACYLYVPSSTWLQQWMRHPPLWSQYCHVTRNLGDNTYLRGDGCSWPFAPFAAVFPFTLVRPLLAFVSLLVALGGGVFSSSSCSLVSWSHDETSYSDKQTHARTHTRTCARTHARTRARTHARTHAHTHTHTQQSARMEM